MAKLSSVRILNAVTTTGASEVHEPRGENVSFTVTGITSSGTGSVVVRVEVSNDGENFLQLATIKLSLSTTIAIDGLATKARYRYLRLNVSSISGTDAQVSAYMGS